MHSTANEKMAEYCRNLFYIVKSHHVVFSLAVRRLRHVLTSCLERLRARNDVNTSVSACVWTAAAFVSLASFMSISYRRRRRRWTTTKKKCKDLTRNWEDEQLGLEKKRLKWENKTKTDELIKSKNGHKIREISMWGKLR